MNNFFKVMNVILMVAITGLLMAIMLTLPAWILWNWLVPDLFGLRELSLPEMFGLMILIRLLLPTHANKIAKE